MTKSAGLSRAYAVLRQLELLRQQDVLDPLRFETDTDTSSCVAISAREEQGRPPHASGGTPSPLVAAPTGKARCHLDAATNSVVSSSPVEVEQSHMRCHVSLTPQPHSRVLRSKDDGSKESNFVKSRDSTATATATGMGMVASSPGGLVEGKNKALQRILQEMMVMRKQAGKRMGTVSDAGGDDSRHHHHHDGQHQQSGSGTQSFSSRSVQHMPSQLGEGDKKEEMTLEDNVFFDDPSPTTHIMWACSTHDEGGDKTPAKGRQTRPSGGEATNKGGVANHHSPNKEACREGRRDASIPQKAGHNSQRKTRDTITSPAVSEYAKSLLRQCSQRQERLRREIQQRKGVQRLGSGAQSSGGVETTMGKPSPTLPSSSSSSLSSAAPLSPIQRILYDGSRDNAYDDDDDDDGFHLGGSPSPSPGVGFDSDTSNTTFNSPACRPLMPFLHRLTAMGSDELQQELLNMEGCCDGSASRCHDWFALTALINSHNSVRQIVVPLLLSELSKHCGMSEHDSGDTNSRMSSILCALIGLGELAAAALPMLLECLKTPHGPPKLIALAIRAVGGDSGLRTLCRVARSSRADAELRMAAVYGISTLAYPVVGHTTIHCIGSPGIENTIVFYQPPVGAGYMELNADGSRRRESSLQRPPPYRPTHLILDTETARQKLLRLTVSKDFRRAAGSYATLPLVLQDFATVAPEACRQQGLPVDVQETLQYEKRQLNDVSCLPPRVLPFSYDPHYIGCEDELFVIEETLMTILLDDRTPLCLVEQTLVSVASLPDFATTHVPAPLLDYIIRCISKFEQRRDGEATEGEEAVLAAGFVALGRIARNEGTPPSVTDRACELLLHGLASSVWRLRHAACIGLGEVGAVSNISEAIARALTECLSDSAMNHETVAWALARLGMRGMRVLLDCITGGRNGAGVSGTMTTTTTSTKTPRKTRDTPMLPVSTRVACVRAIVKVDLLASSLGIREDAQLMREELVQRLSVAISSDNIEEDVVLECAYALAAIVSVEIDTDGGSRGKSVDVAQRNDEAALYYRTETPNEAFKVLKTIVESVILPFSVQKALLYSLCAYGGAYGELYVSQTAIQSPVAASRAAAAFGLRACGGKVIRTLAMALNDDVLEVRLEAFDTLDAVGVDAVLTILRTRPRRHKQQVIAALRDCLLRDLGRNAKRQAAQDLYAALVPNQL